MRVGNVGNARPAYYDRNELPIIRSGTSSTVPGGGTQVITTYTVQASRKMLLNSIYLRAIRSAAAAPVGLVTFGVVYHFQNVTDNNAHALSMFDNALNVPYVLNIQTNILLPTTAVLKIISIDLSTGGAVDLVFGVNAIEFDA